MDPQPRLIAIMGSGETTPTMAKVHRALIDRLGPAPVPAVLIDTPYGFQENASEISARAVEYFRESVGCPIEIATLRSADVDALTHDTAVARVRSARFVFSGPGSPTYALRQWSATGIPNALREKVVEGGALVFASAAALTLGVVTAPIYEVYKAGIAPYWLDGLDLLALAGLRAAVIPHFDNAEGGTHDTRFCYLGERRLAQLERELPPGAFVLGVDGHTALILDLEASMATVQGLGGATVRAGGRSTVFPAGSTIPIGALRLAAQAETGTARGHAGAARATDGAGPTPEAGGGASSAAAAAARSPLRTEVGDLEAAFDAALERRDARATVAAILDLDRVLVDWSRDTEQSSVMDLARAALRSMIVRLGDLAIMGTRDPRETVAPLVDALLEERVRARAARDWAASDRIRERLILAGIEVRDTPSGTEWLLAAPRDGAPDERAAPDGRAAPDVEAAQGPDGNP